ncbi:MAG TPA: TonB-dependent receptor [bacterium]|nr:TonB-dependent receptor [bacterium]HPR86553.1 TonB-dependent receptor [bacterium]
MLKKNAEMAAILLLAALLLAPPPGGRASAGDKWASISGFVRDASNGEPLPYANVYLVGTNLGTLTSLRGYFVIPHLAEGRYLFTVSLLGYQRWQSEVQLHAGADSVLTVHLTPSTIEMGEVTKTAQRERFEREVHISTVALTMRQLQVVPMLAEADVFRTLQLLPGVVSRSDFSSQLYVRGGSPDQNLVLLDGVSVYNPFHLGGVFSTFNVDAIKELEFLSGGFPVEYGGRLSSVLAVTNREGNVKSYRGSGSLSLLSVRGLAEGPLPSGSFLIAARRTYFDQVFKHTRYAFPYYFYDLQGKINLDLSQRHRLTLSGFYGDDVLDFSAEGEDESEVDVDLNWVWGNRTTSLIWRWIIRPDLFSETILSRSRFDNDLDATVEGSGTANLMLDNRINDYSAKADVTYLGLRGHGIKLGFSWSDLDFRYGIAIDDYRLFSYTARPALLALYLQDHWQLRARLQLNSGVRLEHYSLGNRWSLSPRLGLQYQIAANLALKASYGQYTQYLTTVASDEENFSLMDLWLPISKNYRPQTARHYVAGGEWWLPHDLILTMEGYYKTFAGLLDLNEKGIASDPTDDYFVAEGTARGLELLLKRQTGPLQGWLGYSWCLTKRRTAEHTYYPKYDRRHTFHAVLNRRLGRNWTLGVVFSYGSGMPYTPIPGKYMAYEWRLDRNELSGHLVDRPGAKNSARFPLYHRMDVSLRREGHLFGISATPYLQIINLYNRKNVFYYFWDHDANPSRLTTVSMFPLLPTLGVDFAF